jgi:hypothetical protein
MVFTLRDSYQRAKLFPGCDIQVVAASGDQCTLTQLAADIIASAALGSPFAVTIAGAVAYIDANDKSKTPYSAMQTAIHGLCDPP